MSKNKDEDSNSIIIEHYKNNEMFGIHFPYAISEEPFATFSAPFRVKDGRNLESIGDLGKKIIEKLSKIKGITEIVIKPFVINVNFGKCFSVARIILEAQNALNGLIPTGIYFKKINY